MTNILDRLISLTENIRTYRPSHLFIQAANKPGGQNKEHTFSFEIQQIALFTNTKFTKHLFAKK